LHLADKIVLPINLSRVQIAVLPINLSRVQIAVLSINLSRFQIAEGSLCAVWAIKPKPLRCAVANLTEQENARENYESCSAQWG
jgi:hypothetical protein